MEVALRALVAESRGLQVLGGEEAAGAGQGRCPRVQDSFSAGVQVPGRQCKVGLAKQEVEPS